MIGCRCGGARAASFLVAAVGLVFPASAAAHVGDTVPPERVWRAWNTDPWVLIMIGMAAWLYARGTSRLWQRAGTGRGISTRRFGCYAAGLLLLLVALVSPIDALGSTLFSAHMVQHELLIVAAAPLLVVGTPLLAFVWALPFDARVQAGRWTRRPSVQRSWQALTNPLTTWLLHAAAVWTWHAPGLYQATLTSDSVHALQHISFFGTALLFWWAVLRPGRRRLGYGIAVPYLFTTAIYGSALGALLTLSSTPWYPAYAERAALWGFTALEDQQLGGLIMWVPFGIVYTGAALALLALWLRAMEARTVTVRA